MAFTPAPAGHQRACWEEGARLHPQCQGNSRWGGWGCVCSSDLASTCSDCPVFSQSPSQSRCGIHGNRGFPTCGFLVCHGQQEPSEDAGFQGKLGFFLPGKPQALDTGMQEKFPLLAALLPFLTVPGRASVSNLYIKQLQPLKVLKDCSAHTEENIVAPKILPGSCKNGNSHLLQ